MQGGCGVTDLTEGEDQGKLQRLLVRFQMTFLHIEEAVAAVGRVGDPHESMNHTSTCTAVGARAQTGLFRK